MRPDEGSARARDGDRQNDAARRQRRSAEVRAIERLRDYRTRPMPGGMIGAEAARLCGEMEREAKRLGAAGRAWAEAASEGLGESLMESVRATNVSRGVLWLEADHAAARYRTEAWLRGGGEAEIVRRAGRGKIHGVRVSAGRKGSGARGGSGR
ncbi:MAG: hypothetical protein AAF138_05035 [Planctomycetota bacterium]